jgi:hypothetical protein
MPACRSRSRVAAAAAMKMFSRLTSSRSMPRAGRVRRSATTEAARMIRRGQGRARSPVRAAK